MGFANGRLAAAVLLTTVAMVTGQPFNGYLTVIRPDGETISQNFITSPGAPTSISSNRNSPTYFIRLPPSPYVYVPGLGYVSKPPVQNPFFSVPFPANGKPTGIYSLTDLISRGDSDRSESPLSRLSGKYVFNGRPTGGVTSHHSPAAAASLLRPLFTRVHK